MTYFRIKRIKLRANSDPRQTDRNEHYILTFTEGSNLGWAAFLRSPKESDSSANSGSQREMLPSKRIAFKLFGCILNHQIASF